MKLYEIWDRLPIGSLYVIENSNFQNIKTSSTKIAFSDIDCQIIWCEEPIASYEDLTAEVQDYLIPGEEVFYTNCSCNQYYDILGIKRKACGQ